MTMIELPRLIRRHKVVQERVAKVLDAQFHFEEELTPEIRETIAGDRETMTVAVEGIQGVQRCQVRKVGSRFIHYRSMSGGYDTPEKGQQDVHEWRSTILLPDGKWYGIDISYTALIMLIAEHLAVDSQMVSPPGGAS
jgi:hypothetical protein